LEVAEVSSEAAAPTKLKVEVIYNGMEHPLHYTEHELGHALFEQACHAFHIPPPERGALALYLPDNSTEVKPDITVEQAGVKPDTKLILRPREASGGATR
jgi:hypothetical protein